MTDSVQGSELQPLELNFQLDGGFNWIKATVEERRDERTAVIKEYEEQLEQSELWFKSSAELIEVFTMDFLYLQALTLESFKNFTAFFKDKNSMIQTCLEDRFEIFINVDVEQNTELNDVWL